MAAIYRIGSENDTVQTAIDAFASVFFDTPRRAHNIKTGAKPLTATFQLVNGYRRYSIAPTLENAIYAFEISIE